jgi:diguanylate cyclase (GGDEF)-like protein
MTCAQTDPTAKGAQVDSVPPADRPVDGYAISFRRTFRLVAVGLVVINVLIGLSARHQQQAIINYALGVYDTAFISTNYISLAQISFQHYVDERYRSTGAVQSPDVDGLLEEVLDNMDVAIERSISPIARAEGQEIRARIAGLPQFATDSAALDQRVSDIQKKMERLHERNSSASLQARDNIEDLSLKSDLLLLFSIFTSILLAGLVLLAIHRIVTTWRQRSNDHLYSALNGMPQGLSLFDENQNLIACNVKYAEMYGLGPELTRPGTTLRAVLEHRVSNRLAPAGVDNFVEMSLASPNVSSSVEHPLEDGRIISMLGEPLSTGGRVTIHLDVTEKRQSEKKIEFLAYHDPLTGLANRVRLRQHIEEKLEHLQRHGRAAVLCVDLDDFKMVNDTLGHSVGDALLCAVSERLRHLTRETDLVSRTGGDEFAIVQSAEESPADAGAALAARIVEALSVPFEIGDHHVVIGASVGIAIAPDDGDNADQLLKNADLALYRSKEAGRGSFHFFEMAMDLKVQARRLLELDLRKAITAGELELFFQPIVNLAEDRIRGFEALLRWNHPIRGKVGPNEFIPVAEQTGLIVAIGEWVIRQACAEAATWPSGLRVAVNVSPLQFRGGSLVPAVVSALAVSGLPSDQLEIEITEGVLMLDNDATMATLHQLHSLGVRISMDDFGTGYSSLSYLRSFPFDKIKIDQSFVRDLINRPDSIAIIRAVAALGKSFGMTTLAEGVETQEQVDLMRAEGCTEVQGYFYSRPVPASEVARLLNGFQRGVQAAA